jgi:uncharacterized membrane protein YccF (DUF307 family)
MVHQHYEPPMAIAQPYYPPPPATSHATSSSLPQYQYTPPPHRAPRFARHTQHVKVAFVRDRRGPCYWMLNLLWLLLAGWHLFLAWFLAGLILCCTIVMIPCGWQVMKISWFLLFPFGQSIQASQPYGQCGGCNCCMNTLWMITAGWILSLQAVVTGVILCCTIVGIPFGWQCFKLALLCFWPFGMELSPLEVVETTTTVTTYNQLP